MPVFCARAKQFSSPFGWVGIVACDQRVLHISLGHRRGSEAAKSLAQHQKKVCATAGRMQPADTWLESLASRIGRYLEGESDEFHDVSVDLSHLTPFQHRVAAACRTIPYGETLTYGQLARLAGSARAARAVGSVMAGNRVPLIIPCHRVIGAGGRLGGYSAPGGLTTKQRLLALEDAAHSASRQALRRTARAVVS